jgi:mono/diheme cytochrome c family protein
MSNNRQAGSGRTHKFRTAALIALGAAIVGGGAFWWASKGPIAPLDAPPPPASADVLAAGARVVALGDCMVCHTAKGGAAYAGGLGLKTPFGTIYSTNITPEPETGIGRWSLAAFTRALREGAARDGHLLYPAFPYIHYTRMSDRDIALAYSFLMSRTPVKVRQPENDLPPPLKIRPMLAFWNALYLRQDATAPALAPVTGVTRGHYLVDTLGHCASCHSGLNLLGGERQPPFQGGQIDGWDAPALTQLTHGPNPWTQAELAAYLRGGLALSHGAAKGPMRPVTEHLATVPREDVDAIASYLMTMQTPAVPVAASPAAVPQAHAEGAALFAAACAACHAPAAPMMALAGRPGLGRSSALTGKDATNFVQTVLGGIPLEHGSQVYMPPFADTLNDQQIAALANYIRAGTGQPAWQDVSATSASLRKELHP